LDVKKLAELEGVFQENLSLPPKEAKEQFLNNPTAQELMKHIPGVDRLKPFDKHNDMGIPSHIQNAISK